ncbi:EAP30/Vps36 family-domain-containing protein [Kockovaella imperatae]|uniref:Vacuolar protein-sorting-associated protein 36 n=1 Tax=Kockovaella imperatae TaxID=4999 RepID=A0A1Y1UGS0_9TREE|nr:EAP30/Vps36 family-domain-containing protein [Kockovaella imperatae]ORX36706.1 EAP30/Vps36 family-domain-containing protein [Kockovaella imperatae]
MRSSPKITLSMGKPSTNGTGPERDSVSNPPAANHTPETSSSVDIGQNWTCAVCGFVNPIRGFGIPTSSTRCSLCGVSYTPTQASSSSVPTSGAATPVLGQSSTPVPQTPPPPSAPMNDDPEGRIACPACTFLNHRSLRNCEICSTPLPRKPGKPKDSSSGIANSPDLSYIPRTSDGYDIVRLSFRKTGVQDAYRRLKNILSDKVWEREQQKSDRHKIMASETAGPDRPSTPRAGAGIDHIMQSISLDSKAQDSHMQDAFKDLEILMVRAGEMVKMAQSLNAKLTAQQASGTSAAIAEEDATLIRSSLVQLGLSAPALTADMVRDEKKYQQGLAQELGQLLTGSRGSKGLMSNDEGRGVIALDEVWGLWMRARGIALLPPSSLISVLPLLPDNTSPPIRTLVLPSQMRVLYSPRFEPVNLLSRLVDRLTPPDLPTENTHLSQTTTSPTEVASEPSLSLIELASQENLPIGLAKELIESVANLESSGDNALVFGIVRDDQADQASGGTRWYRDLISIWQL